MSRDFMFVYCKVLTSIGISVLMADIRYAGPTFFLMWFVQLLVEKKDNNV